MIPAVPKTVETAGPNLKPKQERKPRIISADANVWAVALSPSGKWLAAGTEDGAIEIWDAATGEKRAKLRGHGAGVTAVGGLLVARWLAADALALRRAFADLACHLRAAAMGLPARLPRLWHV